MNKIGKLLEEAFIYSIQTLGEPVLKKRSSKRRRVSPKGKQSNVRKADVARRAKR